MTGRFWFYLGASVVIVGLYSWRLAAVNSVTHEISRIDQASLQAQSDSLQTWADGQTDERKVVSLAKKLRTRDQALLKILVDRAYAINPNSRDITILASQIHPELKDKILQLDPLYKN
jgi:hypothetical protein